MNKGIERSAILPGRSEVCNTDAGVTTTRKSFNVKWLRILSSSLRIHHDIYNAMKYSPESGLPTPRQEYQLEIRRLEINHSSFHRILYLQIIVELSSAIYYTYSIIRPIIKIHVAKLWQKT